MDEDYQGFGGVIGIEASYVSKELPKFTETIDFVTMFGIEYDDPSWLIEWLNQGLTMNINGQCTFIIYCKWRRHHKHNESYKDFLKKYAMKKKIKNDEEHDNY
jgi:hypothetical protein